MADKETPVVNEEVAAPAAPAPAEEKMVTIELVDQFINNGDKVEVYGPGKVTVTEEVADDLMRRQREVLQAERERLNGADKSRGEVGRV